MKDGLSGHRARHCRPGASREMSASPMRAAAPDASSKFIRWPASRNPVTSVIATGGPAAGDWPAASAARSSGWSVWISHASPRSRRTSRNDAGPARQRRRCAASQGRIGDQSSWQLFAPARSWRCAHAIRGAASGTSRATYATSGGGIRDKRDSRFPARAVDRPLPADDPCHSG